MEENKIIDLSLGQVEKKRIRIDGDDNRILLIDTSDLSVTSRLKQAEERMESLVLRAAEKLADSDGSIDTSADVLKEADEEMRACIDYIFNADVSSVCAPEGTMFDPFNGKFRFEIIIESLAELYGSQLSIEYRKMSTRVKSKTSKYVGK